MIAVTLQTGTIISELLETKNNLQLIEFDGVGYDPYPIDPGDWMLIVVSGAVMVIGTVFCMYICVRGGRRREEEGELREKFSPPGSSYSLFYSPQFTRT